MSSTRILVVIFFISCIPSTIFSLSFNLSKIMIRDPSVETAGDAYISTVGIQLTPDEDSMTYKKGRATYFEPLQLWEKGSGKLTDFSTHFSFLIDSTGNDSYGHGIVFFLAPPASTIQPWSSAGNLGIGRGDSPLSSSSDSFVAVEFDTYQDGWDPSAPHVGININSMGSVATAVWNNSIPEGKLNEAWISYNSSSTTLRVDFTGHFSNGTQRASLSYVVDLRNYLPQSVTFGFSASTGDLYEINTIMSWDFFSTLQKSNSRKKKKAVIVGLGVGLPILILASALFLLVVLWKRKKKKTNSEDSRSEDRDIFDSTIDNEFEEGSGPKRIPYSELAIATNNFAKENKLGEGGFGGVYRGVLRETNSYIAVKRVSQRSRQGIKEYASEVKIISQLRHRNLVQLLGWCHQRGELLLVYEFMPNRSLDTHLFREKPPNLSWRMRHKIALGLASALLYLHQEWERCVVHRDIKSSNIMLDSNFNAKLGDFGLARLVDHEKGAQTTVLAGTLGYMAPESAVTGRASKESDVYSFGIVLLEIACGRRPIERFYPENQLVLVEWVWSLYGAGQLFDAADPKLEKEYDELEMVQLLVVGLWCVHPDSSRRPSIRQAIKVLNSEAPIPTLPPAMPIAMYSFPSMTGATTSTLYSAGFLTSNSSILTTSSGGSKS